MRTLVQEFLSLTQLVSQGFSPVATLDDAGGSGSTAREQKYSAHLSSLNGQAAGSELPLAGSHEQAEQEWIGGVAALAQLLVQRLLLGQDGMASPSTASDLLGVMLSGPFPVLPDRILERRLSNWLLLPAALDGMFAVARPLLPADGKGHSPACDLHTIPLQDDDPLVQERFCLLLTSEFCLTLVLGPDAQGRSQFQFSFDPAMAEQVWRQLRERIARIRPALLANLDQVVDQFAPVAPDFRLVTDYSRLLIGQIRQRTALASAQPVHPVQFAALDAPFRRTLEPVKRQTRIGASEFAPAFRFGSFGEGKAGDTGSDAELLKAMAHEIRTPLTTIRTFTRSLLKRNDISDAVARRLRMIDQECTQQIDRFNLIFRAVELETSHQEKPRSPLSAISLNQLFEDAIPQWQQQASRRNLTLAVEVPPELPMVNSDPTMLNQVLTGLIDRFTHSLPPYSHIQLAVTLAGHQLKLQFQSQPPEADTQTHDSSPEASLLTSPFKALGQLLMFQPETGGLSLNLNVTKNLFQALGGKMIVRQRPRAGEVLTVFLPLESRTL